MSGIDAMLDSVEWERLPDPESTEGLYATHEGRLNIGGLSFRCYTLNDGNRVFDAEDIQRFFGSVGEPRPATKEPRA